MTVPGPLPEPPPVIRRGLAFLFVAALVVLGLAVDQGVNEPAEDAAFTRRAAPEQQGVDRVPPDGTMSAAWYCPEGTSNDDGRADETVAVANAGERPVEAVVTVLRGGESPVRHRVEVPPRSRELVRIADIVETADPGVVVEVFGGEAAVEHQLEGGGDLAVGPCARSASDRWFFAGGTTVKDARDVLALLNPFPDDAIVDMTFFTEDGPEQPTALQALVVPGRSRLAVPVHDHVLRKETAAAEVVVRTGRVVAERSIQWDGSTDRRGFGVVLGVTATAETWTFPEGLAQEGVAEDIWILNPHEHDTAVEIQPLLDGDSPVPPEEVEVAARSATSFRVNDLVEAGVGHSVLVSAVGDEEVVVFQEITATDGSPRPGYAIVPGVREAARRWLFPAGSADDTYDEWIVITNSGVETATFTISVLAGGVLLVPEGLGDLEVPPTSRGSFRLGNALKRSDLPLVVEADQPVAVVRGLFRESAISVSPGTPFAE